jgi:hypothetical protein
MVKRKAKKSKLFGTTTIVGQKSDISRSLKVGRSQISEANRVAQEIGCGTPFRADGMFVGTRSQKKKYMKEINRRRVDQGEPRFVNLDGGYGDET